MAAAAAAAAGATASEAGGVGRGGSDQAGAGAGAAAAVAGSRGGGIDDVADLRAALAGPRFATAEAAAEHFRALAAERPFLREIPGLPGAFFGTGLLDTDAEWDGAVSPEAVFGACCAAKSARKRGFISGHAGPRVAVCGLGDERPGHLRAVVAALHHRAGVRYSSTSGATSLAASADSVAEPAAREAEECWPTQISANVYEPGYALMVPHKDGQGAFGAIVSLGAPSLLRFWRVPLDSPEARERGVPATQVFDRRPREDAGAASSHHSPEGEEEQRFCIPSVPHEPDACVFMEPNSVLILSGEAFTDWAHGVLQAEGDDGARYDPVPPAGCLNAALLSPGALERYDAGPAGRVSREGVRVSIVLWELVTKRSGPSK